MYKRSTVFRWCALLGMSLFVSAEDAPVSLSLEQAIRAALRYNLTLQSSRDQITSADISLETAKSEFKLKIRPEISGLYQQNDELDQQYGIRFSKQFSYGGELSWQARTHVDNTREEEYQTDLTLAYNQPLLRGRGTLSTTNKLISAEQNTRIQHRLFLLAQQRLMVQVASSYYGILRDQMLIEVNERAAERSRLLLQAAEAKLEVGMASKMDVFRAELQLLTAENGLVDANASLENAKQRFNLLLGTDIELEFSLSSALDYTPIPLDTEQLIEQALQNRLELQNAQEQVEEAERQLKIAQQNLYPPLDVSVQYTFRGTGGDLSKSWEMDDDFWGIGVNSSFNIDFAQERAACQQAQLSLNGAIRVRQSAQDDIIAEVLQIIVSVRQGQASVDLQKQSVAQAEKQLELSALRYKKGLSDNLDVVNAEENLVKAKTNYYSAIVQHLIAKMRLQQVTGTLEIPF